MVKRKPVATRGPKKRKKSVIKPEVSPEVSLEPVEKVKKPRAPRGSKKAMKCRIATKYTNVRKFRNPDEPETLTSGIYCSVADKNCTLLTCALGICGERHCPHYRGERETQLLLEHYENKPLTSVDQVLFDIVTDPKTGAKKVLYKVSW